MCKCFKKSKSSLKKTLNSSKFSEYSVIIEGNTSGPISASLSTIVSKYVSLQKSLSKDKRFFTLVKTLPYMFLVSAVRYYTQGQLGVSDVALIVVGTVGVLSLDKLVVQLAYREDFNRLSDSCLVELSTAIDSHNCKK